MGKTRRKKTGNWILALIILVVSGFLISNTSEYKKINYPIKYKEQVIRFSSESKVDPYLIFAIMKAESGFNPRATSPKNAKGLMQLMDTTAEEIALKLKIEGFTVEDLYDPDINVRIGCWHVSRLMKEFGEEKYGKANIDLIIAAYNGGSRNVKEWLKNNKYSTDGKSLDVIPFRETDRFLKKVKSFYLQYKKLYENSI